MRKVVSTKKLLDSTLAIGVMMTICASGALAASASIPGMAAGHIFGKLLGKGLFSPSKSDIEKALSGTAADMNKRLPEKIDDLTRLDRVSAGPGLRLTYSYTITAASSLVVNSSKLEQVMGARLRSGLCARENELLKYGVTLTYSYDGNDGGYIGMISVLPQDCGFR